MKTLLTALAVASLALALSIPNQAQAFGGRTRVVVNNGGFGSRSVVVNNGGFRRQSVIVNNGFGGAVVPVQSSFQSFNSFQSFGAGCNSCGGFGSRVLIVP